MDEGSPASLSDTEHRRRFEQAEKPGFEKRCMNHSDRQRLADILQQPEHGVIEGQVVAVVPDHRDCSAGDNDNAKMVSAGHQISIPPSGVAMYQCNQLEIERHAGCGRGCFSFDPTWCRNSERPRWGRWSSLNVSIARSAWPAEGARSGLATTSQAADFAFYGSSSSRWIGPPHHRRSRTITWSVLASSLRTAARAASGRCRRMFFSISSCSFCAWCTSLVLARDEDEEVVERGLDQHAEAAPAVRCPRRAGWRGGSACRPGCARQAGRLPISRRPG